MVRSSSGAGQTRAMRHPPGGSAIGITRPCPLFGRAALVRRLDALIISRHVNPRSREWDRNTDFESSRAEGMRGNHLWTDRKGPGLRCEGASATTRQKLPMISLADVQALARTAAEAMEIACMGEVGEVVARPLRRTLMDAKRPQRPAGSRQWPRGSQGASGGEDGALNLSGRIPISVGSRRMPGHRPRADPEAKATSRQPCRSDGQLKAGRGSLSLKEATVGFAPTLRSGVLRDWGRLFAPH